MILTNEYQNIGVVNEEPVNKNKKVKLRKKSVTVTQEYYKNKVIGE
jgi:hypothetical protein